MLVSLRGYRLSLRAIWLYRIDGTLCRWDPRSKRSLVGVGEWERVSLNLPLSLGLAIDTLWSGGGCTDTGATGQSGHRRTGGA